MKPVKVSLRNASKDIRLYSAFSATDIERDTKKAVDVKGVNDRLFDELHAHIKIEIHCYLGHMI